eukprot:CAMPEP_0114226328 /NCGR_PEP_ID=MMETSP0058-20121206/1178_1 /TAXON_ID=36894 /ORGANISM="Pyramimonas parkeae, CCMP726" /LENGTH=91 /DNA_ID=CAMNT_0001337055 /DNA_START=135 /DNA_END=406 /DNA_ORIENTATION=+
MSPDTQQDSTKLALPSPHDGVKSNETTSQHIVVGGESVQMDHLGPIVLNTDGTLSRISNWGEMSTQEQQNTLRLVGKRNRQRREKIVADQT